MCVHNCRGFRSFARYKFTCYFCGWLRWVAVWAAYRCKKCFYVWFLLFSMREKRNYWKSIFISIPSRNIFHFFKLRYSINLSYFLSLFLGSRRKGEKEQTRKNCHFSSSLFTSITIPWQWNFIFHNRKKRNSLEKCLLEFVLMLLDGDGSWNLIKP